MFYIEQPLMKHGRNVGNRGWDFLFPASSPHGPSLAHQVKLVFFALQQHQPQRRGECHQFFYSLEWGHQLGQSPEMWEMRVHISSKGVFNISLPVWMSLPLGFQHVYCLKVGSHFQMVPTMRLKAWGTTILQGLTHMVMLCLPSCSSVPPGCGCWTPQLLPQTCAEQLLLPPQTWTRAGVMQADIGVHPLPGDWTNTHWCT